MTKIKDKIKKQIKELLDLTSKGLYPIKEYKKDIAELRKIPTGQKILAKMGV